jgi:hypothetical protein
MASAQMPDGLHGALDGLFADSNPGHPPWARSFILSNIISVLKREADVVEAFEEAVPHEFFHREFCSEAACA